MPHDALACLEEIIASAALIKRYAGGMTIDDYIRDDKSRDAVERRFTILGEALVRVRDGHPEIFERIEYAHEVVRFRNIVVHAYDAIDNQLVWEIIGRDLDQLSRDCAALRDEIAEVGNPD